MSPTLLTRRQALRQTFFYSAAAALASRLPAAAAPAPKLAPMAAATADLHFLMLGDFGVQVLKPSSKPTKQAEVAAGMQAYIQAQNLKPEGLFLLGDNFYGKFDGGLASPRWKTGFEEMYPSSIFPGPCWAMLGNHDYNEEVGVKMEAQLAYAKAFPSTRWTMPSKWYRVDYPKVNPVATFLVLDSNYLNVKQSLTPAERAEQSAWLKVELAKPRIAPFLICMGHHPLYSNGPHGDHKHLIDEWGPLFQQHGVSAYFCGHDHDLQHLEFAGQNTSFVVSGGGGAHTTKMKKAGRGPFANPVYGFTHLQLSRSAMTVRHLDPKQRLLHAFTRPPAGPVQVLASQPLTPEELAAEQKALTPRPTPAKQAGATPAPVVDKDDD